MMIRRKQNRSQHLRVRKQNNRGSAIILVIAVMAIIGILVVTLLTLSLMNYRMKYVNLHSQKNFYGAEAVMDEIRSGLSLDISNAVGEAYRQTLENYGKTDAQGRKSTYINIFGEHLTEELEEKNKTFTGPSTLHYSLTHLQDFVSDKVKDGAKKLEIISTDGMQVLNSNSLDGSYTIKNLSVTYIDQQNYMTNITTDITLSCPPIDYSQKSTMPNLLSYALVASEKTQITGAVHTEVSGSAYFGSDGADINNSSVTLSPVDSADRFIAGESVRVYNGSSVSVSENKEASSGIGSSVALPELWFDELCVDSSQVTIGNQIKTYLANDLVLEKQGSSGPDVSLNGEVRAFGNLASAFGSSVFVDEQAFTEKCTNNPAAVSSAFLINGKDATLDLSGVTSLMIAGNAYVGATKNNADNADVMMGESISLKSDQRAYLVPGKYIAAGTNFGGVNPMTEDVYNSACEELAQGQVFDAQHVPVEYFITSEDGTPGQIPGELKNRGVVGIQREVYRMATLDGNGGVPVIYFFLVFDNANDAAAYGKTYQDAHQDVLNNRVNSDHYNTSITYSDDFLNQTPDSFQFYYNGSVLVPAKQEQENTRFLVGRCTQVDTQKTAELKTEQMNLQERYAALRHKLLGDTGDYDTLTYAEKNRSVYNNLVLPMVGGDAKYTIPNGTKKVFRSDEKANAAIVVNGDYTWDGSDSDVHVIIASGNVTVDADFEGMILAGKDVLITKQVALKANASLAAEALAITNEDKMRAADYLVAGENYLTGTAEGTKIIKGAISFDDYIAYSNWSKQ